ncbi:MAG: GumC family protein [Bacteroidota bacterium]
MTIIQFIRLIKKHIWLLISAPLLLGILVFWFTANQPKSYKSSVTFYTGLASGHSINSDNSGKIDYHATQTAFDNFINILKSRKTIENIALRLLATHLMMDKPDPNYLSAQNFRELQEIVPDEVKMLVEKGDLDKTVYNLMQYKKPNKNNFIYGLLNYEHPHYSYKAISNAEASRLSESDLIEVSYESDDPGISRLTLEILTNTFTNNYKTIKTNRTDEVIAYFENKLDNAQQKLYDAENELLEFNQSNNIINYYEQTKFIASKKEDLDVDIQQIRMKKAGAEAAIKKLESQLPSFDKLKLQSSEIINLRDSISVLNSRASLLEATATGQDTSGLQQLAILQQRIDKLEQELKAKVSALYAYSNTKENINKKEILSSWFKNVIEFESIKGSLQVLEQRKNDFLKRYRTFAPLGATLKRIERKINVSEKEYLSLLHSLGLARLREQNIKFQSDIKVLSEPYFPLNPEPSRRKIIVIAAALVGFIFVLFIILLLEYLDATLRFPSRAEKQSGMPVVSVFPILTNKNSSINFPYLTDRLTAMLLFDLKKKALKVKDEVKIILFYSSNEKEGKTTILRHLAQKLNEQNYHYLYINHQKTEALGITNKQDENEIVFDLSKLPSIASKKELIEVLTKTGSKPEFILIELPGIISNEYPLSLTQLADYSYNISRANRLWTNADIKAQQNIEELLKDKPGMLLNGTEPEAVEMFLGEVPKQRSKIAKVVKRILGLQFYSRQKIKN